MIALESRAFRYVRASVSGALLTALVGLLLWGSRIGLSLVHLSFDLPCVFSPGPLSTNVILVKMDGESMERLGTLEGKHWDRSWHARLIEKLRRDGSRLVVMDMVLGGVQEPAKDEELARALRAHGRVVLAAGSEPVNHPFAEGIAPEMPQDLFREAVEERVGMAGVWRETDGTVRRHLPELWQLRSLAWVAAEQCGAAITRSPPDPEDRRWIWYYGGDGFPPCISYHLALGMADGYFSNRIVFVGGWPTTRRPGEFSDEYRTPYTRWDGNMVSGVDLQAVIFLNLLRGDFLRRMGPLGELLTIVLAGALLGAGLTLLRPAFSVPLAAVLFFGCMLVATWLTWKQGVWLAWMIVGGAQIPTALGWSILVYAGSLYRENRRLKTVFGTEGTDRPPEPVRSSDEAATAVEDELHVPNHTLLRQVGEGAFGEVWLAQNQVGHHVAVKVVHRHNLPSNAPYEREFDGIRNFWEVSGTHESLLRVLHVGRNDSASYFFYIMEVADDAATGRQIVPESYVPRDLARDFVLHGRYDVRESLALTLPLASALAHLHEHGLVHRDVKPSNVIFVNGKPKLADIGLVTPIRPDLTDSRLKGTLGYLAPEGSGQPPADVYALGKVLYELSTGLDRFRFPDIPGELISGPDGAALAEMNQVLLKACQRDPAARHPTAKELHRDLLRLAEQLGPSDL